MDAADTSATQLPEALQVHRYEDMVSNGAPANGAAVGYDNGDGGNGGHRRLDSHLSSDESGGEMPIPAYRPPLQDRSLLPDGRHSLSGISLRALAMGVGLGAGATAAAFLAWSGASIWRAPFFVAALSLFHFLEFWTTAEYNTALATPGAFLLTTNGMAYNVAHLSALLETVFVHSGLLSKWMGIQSLGGRLTTNNAQLALGFVLLIVGQVTRSLAMATAGRSFNHTVQTYRRQEHSLVTSGIYAYLRHPSYFGFYWWAIGTQVIMGNVVCFGLYAVILWHFFRDRIQKEEVYLISFFGKEYIDYRSRTRVGIPYIP